MRVSLYETAKIKLSLLKMQLLPCTLATIPPELRKCNSSPFTQGGLCCGYCLREDCRLTV